MYLSKDSTPKHPKGTRIRNGTGKECEGNSSRGTDNAIVGAVAEVDNCADRTQAHVVRDGHSMKHRGGTITQSAPQTFSPAIVAQNSTTSLGL
jgi:hypothetical protein